jgi:hypothetical protein
LQRLVEPVYVKKEDKVGDDIGNYKNSPVWEEDNVPGNKPRQNFQESLNRFIVLYNKFPHMQLLWLAQRSSDAYRNEVGSCLMINSRIVGIFYLKKGFGAVDYFILGKREASDFTNGPENCFWIFSAVSGRKGLSS